MEDFEKRKIQTSRGLTYTYYVSHSKEKELSTPALLFHHGWPDHAAMWSDICTRLRAEGIRNTMIVPDMLGYGETSKPTDPSAYTFDLQTQDISEILDAEHIDKIISSGHDWGSAAASRFYSFHPHRVVGMILLNAAYMTPTREEFSLDRVNNMTEKIFGYPLYAYWHFFTAPDAPQVLRDNVARLYSALHSAPSEGMKGFFCVPGAIRKYLEDAGQTPDVPVRSYAQDSVMKDEFVERMTRDGFDGPQCWYKAARFNHHYETEKNLPTDRDKLNVPLLYVGGTDDAVCRPEIMAPSKGKGLIPDLEEHMVDAAHWTPYEKPQEITEFIAEWLGRKFPGSKA